MAMEVIPKKRKRGRPYIQGTEEATMKVTFTLPKFLVDWLNSKREKAKKGKGLRGRSKYVRNLLLREKGIENNNGM
jgi:hypothetical protein